MVRDVVAEPSPALRAASAASAASADPRRSFVRELGRLEVEVVRQLVADPSWLAADDEAVVRWALALARLSAVPVRADEGAAGVVELGEASQSYRQRLHALVSSCFDGERPRREALRAAVGSLAAMATQRPEAGQHRVINHVTERDPCILDIAEVVSRAARAHGYTPAIDRGGYNPRCENDAEKAAYRVENAYVASQVSHTPFEKVLAPMFATVATYRDRIRPEVFPPRVRWER